MVRKVLKNRFAELLAIRERRENRIISQREIAENVGCALNTINNIAQNKPLSYIHRETIEKLMVYLDVDHTDFFETVEIEEDEETALAVAV